MRYRARGKKISKQQNQPPPPSSRRDEGLPEGPISFATYCELVFSGKIPVKPETLEWFTRLMGWVEENNRIRKLVEEGRLRRIKSNLKHKNRNAKW